MAADLSLQLSTQDLALSVATAYFNVLGARDQLIALAAAKKATLEQLQQAKREFEVGTKTIIDTNEAQARYDQIVAQEQVDSARCWSTAANCGRSSGAISAPWRRCATAQPDAAEADRAEGMGARREDTLHGADRARQLRDRRTRSAEAKDAWKPTVDVVGGYTASRATGNTFNGLDTNLTRDRSASSSTCRTRPGWYRAACARRCRSRTASTPSSSWPAALPPTRRATRIPESTTASPRCARWNRLKSRRALSSIDATRLPGRRAHPARRAERHHPAGAELNAT